MLSPLDPFWVWKDMASAKIKIKEKILFLWDMKH